MIKERLVMLLSDLPRGRTSPPAFANTTSSLPLSRLICAKMIQIAKVRHVPDAGIASDSFTAAANSVSRRFVMKTYAFVHNRSAVARPMPLLPQ